MRRGPSSWGKRGKKKEIWCRRRKSNWSSFSRFSSFSSRARGDGFACGTNIPRPQRKATAGKEEKISRRDNYEHHLGDSPNTLNGSPKKKCFSLARTHEKEKVSPLQVRRIKATTRAQEVFLANPRSLKPLLGCWFCFVPARGFRNSFLIGQKLYFCCFLLGSSAVYTDTHESNRDQRNIFAFPLLLLISFFWRQKKSPNQSTVESDEGETRSFDVCVGRSRGFVGGELEWNFFSNGPRIYRLIFKYRREMVYVLRDWAWFVGQLISSAGEDDKSLEIRFDWFA